MRLAISNIAWDTHEDPLVAQLLSQFGLDAIDIAPSKYFSDPVSATDKEIANVRRWWGSQGIEITGMQALLFGTSGLNIFGDNGTQTTMLEHLRAVCHIGAELGATRLVFGSPKNRDRSNLSDIEALEEACSFFSRLGDIAKDSGVIVCLEPNPTRYGANFMTSSDETARVVTAVGHKAIRMQFDTGALVINHESPEAVLKSYAGLIGHIHASEPDLIPLGDAETEHRLIHKTLLNYIPQQIVSIEMVATKEESHLESITRAISYAIACYRPGQEVV